MLGIDWILETQGNMVGCWDMMAIWRPEAPREDWDTPPTVSAACDCDPLGAESPQCEQDNGQCQCRLGFEGLRCDRCQRGYQEPFPHCSPCHPCFGRWDLAVGSLREGLQRLGAQVQALREGGSALPLSPRRLRELEETLGHVEQLLGDGDSPVGPLMDGLPRQLGGTRQVYM